MLIIFKLQLTFTDFESSGENIKTEAMFLQNLKNLFFETFWNIFVTVRVWRRMYVYRQSERTANSENLTSGRIFFKEGLIWLV